MKPVIRCSVAACAALACASIDCKSDKATGPSLVEIAFSSHSHWCAGYAPDVVTVTQLLGPNGASTTNPLPGVWVARGVYNLTGSGYTSAVIELGFIGSFVTSENGQSVEQVPYTITGALTGSFEVRGGYVRLEAGPGTPAVMTVSGSSALDCIELY